MNAIASPVSETQRLADYLRGLGYPIAQVTPEDNELTGNILMFDTNPEKLKGVVSQRLEIEVDFHEVKERGKPKRTEISCVVWGVRRGKNGRIAKQVRFSVGDLSDLESDPDLKSELAQLVVDDLKLNRPEKVFDAKMLELESDLYYARKELRECEERLAKYKEERAKK